MPCQTPSASAPAITGTWSDTPVSMVYMRRHVVRPLDILNPVGVGRREAIKRAHKIGAYVGIGVFLDDEGGRSMPHEDEQRAVLRAGLLDELRRLARDVGEGLSPGLEHERRSRNSLGRDAGNGRQLIIHGRLAIAAWSNLFQHVLLQRRDHLNQATPDLLDEVHDLVEIGIVSQLQTRLLPLDRWRLRLDGARQRQIARKQLFLDRCVFALKPRDLGLERRALVRHRLAGPSDWAPRAERYLAGTAVKPQIPVIDAVEGVAAVVALRHRALRPSRRPREHKSGDHE